MRILNVAVLWIKVSFSHANCFWPQSTFSGPSGAALALRKSRPSTSQICRRLIDLISPIGFSLFVSRIYDWQLLSEVTHTQRVRAREINVRITIVHPVIVVTFLSVRWHRCEKFNKTGLSELFVVFFSHPHLGQNLLSSMT